jgi:hypothetical protein
MREAIEQGHFADWRACFHELRGTKPEAE